MSPLFGPDPSRILDSGNPLPGRIIGIEATTTHDDPPIRLTAYAVEAGGTVHGVRQWLSPADEVRLGMPVTLRVDGRDAVIEWGDGGTERWKSLRTPPTVGITDDHDGDGNRGALSKARRGGRAATVTVQELQTRTVAMGLGVALDARVRADPAQGDPYEATIPKVDRVPGYAAHLLVVGATLPAWETRGLLGSGLMIDWPAAAEADPGVGRAPAALPHRGAPGSPTSAMTLGGAPTSEAADEDDEDGIELPGFARSIMGKFGVSLDGATAAPSVEVADGVVPWETFVAIQHEIEWAGLKKAAVDEFAVSRGVPTGEWPTVQRHWQAKMASDPALAVAYGQAMSRP